MNYEFRFGNGINGKKLPKDSQVVIFYIISNGESAILGDDTINNTSAYAYDSSFWSTV
jgi:hypothetical protein